MNYPFATASPYIQAAMSQAVQAIMNGTPAPANCLIMAMPFQQAHQMLVQLRMKPPAPGSEPIAYPQPLPPPSYYGPTPYRNGPPTRALVPQQNYNYPVVPYVNNHQSKPKNRQQPHSNIYNSSSFDSYMHNLSWSRIFHHHRASQKPSKRQKQDDASNNADKKSNSSKKHQSNSSLSSSSSSSSNSSTTSDETIRRVTVTSRPPSNNNSKQQTKGSLPFKYSSEFIPGLGKQQSQPVKSNDVFVIKKP